MRQRVSLEAPAARQTILNLMPGTGCRLYSVQSFALAGGLLVYGIDPIDPYRRAASYVDRILKGTPVELLDEPTKRADVSEKRCSDTCVDVMAPEGEMRAFPRRLSKLIATASNGLPARNDRLYADLFSLLSDR